MLLHLTTQVGRSFGRLCQIRIQSLPWQFSCAQWNKCAESSGENVRLHKSLRIFLSRRLMPVLPWIFCFTNKSKSYLNLFTMSVCTLTAGLPGDGSPFSSWSMRCTRPSNTRRSIMELHSGGVKSCRQGKSPFNNFQSLPKTGHLQTPTIKKYVIFKCCLFYKNIRQVWLEKDNGLLVTSNRKHQLNHANQTSISSKRLFSPFHTMFL